MKDTIYLRVFATPKLLIKLDLWLIFGSLCWYDVWQNMDICWMFSVFKSTCELASSIVYCKFKPERPAFFLSMCGILLFSCWPSVQSCFKDTAAFSGKKEEHSSAAYSVMVKDGRDSVIQLFVPLKSDVFIKTTHHELEVGESLPFPAVFQAILEVEQLVFFFKHPWLSLWSFEIFVHVFF